MKKIVYAGLFTFFVSVISFTARAESTVGYFGFEPDIITNYIGASSKKMGYVRVTIDLMLTDTSDIAVVGPDIIIMDEPNRAAIIAVIIAVYNPYSGGKPAIVAKATP